MDEEQIRAEFEAELREWSEEHLIRPVDRSAALESMRRQAERVVGQPVVAQWDADGRRINISYPVIDKTVPGLAPE